MWDFAKLSAEARELGGPQALRAAYRQIGVAVGRKQGFAGGVLVAGGAAAAWKGVKRVQDRRTAVAQAAADTVESQPSPDEAVLAEAGAVIATVDDGPVSDDTEPERAPVSTDAALPAPAADDHFSA